MLRKQREFEDAKQVELTVEKKVQETLRRFATRPGWKQRAR
jgi:hypothetical protein